MTFGALAAALVIAITGIFAWSMSVQGDDSGGAVTAVRPLLQDSGATAGYVVLLEDDGEARVVSDAMPQLDESQSYQLWSLSALGEPTSLGLMAPGDGGRANARVTFDAARTQQIAITIEPAGGSEEPTTPALYVADL